MILDLLRLQPEVGWVRASSTTFDRDQGRDLLIERYWAISESPDPMILDRKTTRVVGQCKVRKAPVGKRDVPDIFDTIERHQAHGFFLAVSTSVTNDLSAWFDLQRTKGLDMNWWTRQEIEQQLRRHPEVAKRYPELVCTARTP